LFLISRCFLFIITSNYISQVEAYSTNWSDWYTFKIYGISQNSDTKDYIIVLENSYCKECGEIYAYKRNKWCKSCQINKLNQNFANWTSGTEEIDNFIKETQLEINTKDDIIVEWIPYDQFNNIKNIDKDSFSAVYSAIWKDGSLKYSFKERKQIREPNEGAILKCLSNSQNNISKFLNEV
jgi:predicted Zn-ribbon and HTH transcriptional regulator